MQVSGNSFSVPTYKESKLSKNDPYGIVHWLFLMLRTSNVIADNVHIKLVLFFSINIFKLTYKHKKYYHKTLSI